MSDHTAEPSPSNHCECGAPMLVMLDENNTWSGEGSHVSMVEEIWPGLAQALDGHHQAMLCGKCDGTESFDAHYHLIPDAST